MTKSEAPIAVDRVQIPPGADPDFAADRDGHAIDSETSGASGALPSLMKQRRDELDAFVVEVKRGREFSGNRDSSQRL